MVNKKKKKFGFGRIGQEKGWDRIGFLLFKKTSVVGRLLVVA